MSARDCKPVDSKSASGSLGLQVASYSPNQPSGLSDAFHITYTNQKELNALIGQRIHRYRKSKSMTLQHVAEVTGFTTSQISQVERGKNAASVWLVARISNALGMQVSELLTGL